MTAVMRKQQRERGEGAKRLVLACHREETREGRETVLEMEDQGEVENNYELEIKMIEQRTNQGIFASPAFPSLPAGISFSRVCMTMFFCVPS